MNRGMRRFAVILLAALLLIGLCAGASAGSGDAIVQIDVGGDSILVNGARIGEDEGEAVYLRRVVETHPDAVRDVENKVITISRPGVYRFRGAASDAQIRVDIDESLTETTTLILDGLTISCDTAPAILIARAFDEKIEGRASVILQTAEGSINTVNGSHTAEDEASGAAEKNDGAISSNVSLILDGGGSLAINADNEGIETKMHLTINGGVVEILSHDDAINASEDNVSHIIINGGTIVASSTLGQEGDGIDSNGALTINGGTVFAFGNENSMDSGLDSDLGITINGGTVLGTGNMYDEINEGGAQEFIALQFAQKNDQRVTLADGEGRAVFSYDPQFAFSVMTISTPSLTKGVYTLVQGGGADGAADHGLILEPTGFTGGAALRGAVSAGRMGPGAWGGEVPAEGEMPPAGDWPSDGAMPEFDPGNPPEVPEGIEGEFPQWADGFMPGDGMGFAQGELSATFDLNDGNVFTGITA